MGAAVQPQAVRTRTAELRDHARTLTPGGVHSNVRLAGPSVFFERGEGAWLYDVDGNGYVDYLLGQGPNFLGHASTRVNDAVARESRRGTIFGGQHVLENEAGELFLDTVGWAERVRFGLTGTEADQVALRLARAATGRTKFVRFEGTYHGWLDNVLVTAVDGKTAPASKGQLAHHLDDTYFLPFNDVDAVAATLSAHDDVAAVIVEPVMCNSAAIMPRDGYLQQLRRLCDRHGIVLIFDEVITGFRLALGGAAERFGVTPDLAVYGKAMAGGWPVSALAGSAALMDMFGGEVNHSGTFNSSVPACAAVIAALTTLREDPPYTRVEDHGMKLMAGIRELALRYDVPMRIQGLPMAFHVSFGDPSPIHDHSGLARLDLTRYAAFAQNLVSHGVWVAPRGIWYVSSAHGDRELAAALERFEAALATGA
ncbi:aspartate aminotransferase family protein [Phytoactinopolyspora halotolerans]|uniref:Aspartate aminotransferase family protein n=1 Tax=Phytoactinopolyspora halotolerans TaxID=1981512 RepID=A0A6L9S9J4_9ACTN|nr:aspartate aminotransferase family protein [Phytoactinopolyspora halotolerans]NEE01896.1 aspartate aminotransferase family protein [Phytoactinopolyspora halotolerans]